MSDIQKPNKPRRGRPAKQEKTETAQTAQAEPKQEPQQDEIKQANTGRGRPQTNNVESNIQRVEKEAGKRKAPRVSMARTKKLDAEPREGYYRRWFNERRVAQAEAAYYTHVEDGEGNKVTRPAGNGEERLYLMEIEERFHQEDVEESRKRIHSNIDEKLQKLGDEEYIPEGNGNPLTNR
jgi:hypothetical protein